jgi:chemotaxis protein MotB
MARGKKHEEHGGMHVDERWVVPYADMMTLLLAVFVMLFALSNIDVRKFAALAQSMATAFNTDVMTGNAATTVTSGEAVSPGAGTMDSGSGVIQADFATLRANLSDFAIQNGIDDRLQVARSSEGIVIRIGGSLLFESGRAVLSAPSSELLGRVVTLLKPLPNHVRIEGHTDDIPPDGFLFRDNWQLSVARAKAVLDSIVATGVDPSRLAIEGLAQYEPLVANDTEEDRARNRRVDLVILYPDVTAPAATTDPGALPGIFSATPQP